MLGIYFTPIESGSLNFKNTGLGNILYELSSQYGICKKYNIQMNLYHLHYYIQKLKSLGHDVFSKTIFRHFLQSPMYLNVDCRDYDIHIWEDKFAETYSNNLIDLVIQNKDKNVLIKDSYLQSIQYYNENVEELQELFSPDEESLNTIYSKYPELHCGNVINISIHLRLLWGNIRYKYSFIQDAIHYLKEHVLNDNEDKIILYVVSDNIQEAKHLFENINVIENMSVVFCENNYDYIDIWTMSLCHHNIICHSTFGWWGAYLNKNKNKCVIYPNDYGEKFCKKVLGRNENDISNIMKNIFPENWVCLKGDYILC